MLQNETIVQYGLELVNSTPLSAHLDLYVLTPEMKLATPLIAIFNHAIDYISFVFL